MLKKLLAIFAPWKVRPTESTAPTKSSIDKVADAVPETVLAVPVDILPEVSHPAWQRLLDRQVTLETGNFALQMMLTWARSHLQADSSEAAKLQKINVLRMYFKKNQHVLQKELKQLFG